MSRRAGPEIFAFLARRLNFTPTYSAADLAGAALAGAAVAVWGAVAAGTFSVRALVASEAAFLSFYLVGSSFAGWGRLAAGALFDLPLRLLMGYAGVNTALLVLAWLSPLGIVANFGVVLAASALLFLAARPARRKQRADWVGFAAVGLSLAAATLWCQDSLRPTSVDGNIVTFEPWIDGFYHAVHLRIFGVAHGASTIEDFRMAGVPARLYHYGAYLTPALIRQASGLHAYAAFAGVLAPLGVAFTGLGAYALFGSFWGAWPGLAAAAALLLLPDGAQQGMQNTFMSYHWLTQISPSASYGLALLAAAWLFVLLGCTRASRLQLAAGWVLGAVLAVYKLHFFIAGALLFLLVPALFFAGTGGARRRVLWATGAVALYAVTLALVQRVPGVPTIRFDGSSLGQIFSLIKQFAQHGALREFLDAHLGVGQSALSNVALGVPYVLLSTLGLFVPLLIGLVVALRHRAPAVLVVFPLLLLANFLAMFLGLALDLHSSTPDELSHRPVMIVYFIVVAWIGGAAGLLALESRGLTRVARPALLGLAVLLLAIPAFLGSGVQRISAMPMFSPVRVPLGLVRAAEYMRDHGDRQDVFQDSQFDRTCAVAALAERSPYAARTLTIMTTNGELLQRRIDQVDRWMSFRAGGAVAAMARQLGIRWFLLDPGDQVKWSAELIDHPVFELGGYRLYRF
ncbi:MAG TPA: hypothetical protein VHM31_24745 [Polyangia bacterium]|nr:hypothetical protein [Polyangia bacterium]